MDEVGLPLDMLLWPIAIVIGVALLVIVFYWRKGRPFSSGDVFRASRLSRGNFLLPTQVLITPTNVVHFTPQMVGRQEHSIHIAHVSSVGIDTNLFFSDVIIETSGGATPIKCHGHRKKDAIRMKALIEQYQTAYYRGSGPPPERSAKLHNSSDR
jgi:hypothetical protein